MKTFKEQLSKRESQLVSYLIPMHDGECIHEYVSTDTHLQSEENKNKPNMYKKQTVGVTDRKTDSYSLYK